MLSLRTAEGLDFSTLTAHDRAYLLENARRYVVNGLLTEENGRLKLSREGLFVSDMVTSDLMRA
jgi:oxygen-independent coproporphyrinogen-3 oxidase